jgi:methylglutaconyl-CoA hydratase
MLEAAEASTQSGTVKCFLDGSVATVAFSHPKGNSLPAPLLNQLAEKFDGLARDPESSVIILRSGGSGTFCAGASFDELKAIRDEAHGKEFFSGFARLILAMRRCPKFIIARVQGKAVGGGVGIIAAADYSFALPSAAVRLTELSLGIGPFVVGPAIERRIGRSAFAAMAIDTDWRDAAWCERHGLYTRVLDTEPALDSVLPSVAARLASFSPAAMRQLKRVLWEDTDDWETVLFQRAELSGRLIVSDQSRRAIQALEQQGASGEVRAVKRAEKNEARQMP